MKCFQHIALLLLFVSGSMRLHAQEYSYAHYDVKDGLASSVVYDAAKDHDGFMWFATETGLSRFDGTQFRNFTIADGLPDNEIMKVFVDSRNRIWLMPFRNALSYYYKGKIFTAANDSVLSKIQLTSHVVDIVEDRQGTLLILEGYASHILTPDQQLITFKNIEGRGFNNMKGGLDSQGVFQAIAGVVAKGMSLYQIVNNKPKIIWLNDDFTPNGPTTIIRSPFVDVMRHKGTLNVYHYDTLNLIKLPEHLVGVSMLPNFLLSINTAQGAYIHRTANGQLIDTFLVGRHVSAVVADHEGNWWFCTLGQGIFRLISSEFQNFGFSDDGRPLPVYSILKYDSVFYFGLDKFRLATVKGNQFEKRVVQVTTTTGRITAMAKPDAEHLIVGTDHGLILFRNWQKINEIPALSVKSLWMKDDRLLATGHTGVYYMDFSNFNILDTVWRERGTWAWKLGDTFYIGTLSGLYQLIKNDTTVLGKGNLILSRRITSMTDDKQGNLWVGTYGEGVLVLRNGKVIRSFSEKNGLSSNNCRALFIQGNDVWVGTERGLNKIHLVSEPRITKFTIADGLASDIINSVYVDGPMVYVGTSEGLTRFNEARISQESTCLLKITAISTGTTTWTYDTANFLLPHNNRQLRFEFAGISFKSGGDITYHYRLHGLNNEWQTTRSLFLSYPTLPSGEYRFECYAVNKFGIQSNMLTIPFIVEKTIWEKWWFRILAGLVLITAVWIFIVFRLKILRRREQTARKMEQRITELEQMALKAQMNPHFIFNSLNSIQQYVLENDFTGVNNFISGFASLIRQTLDVSSKHKISLEEEVKYISTYLRLEKMRLEDKFTYEINVREDIIVSDYFIPPLILQPCLENSIRHGVRYRKDKNGRITVNILKDQTYLIFVIEDNGVGRKLAAQYKGARHIEYQSRGMALTTSRIEMLSANGEYKSSVDWEDITNQEGEVAGTRVIIRLPLTEVL